MECLQDGDLAPRFIVADDKGKPFDLGADNIAGRIIVLVFYRTHSDSIGALNEFIALQTEFEKMGANIVAIGPENKKESRKLNGTVFPFTALPAAPLELFHAYGIKSETCTLDSPTTTVIVRPNGHVFRILTGSSQAAHAVTAVKHLSIAAKSSETANYPPILTVPDVLSASECAQLISAYDNSQAPFVKPQEVLGQAHDVKSRIPDYGRQDRIDLLLNSHEMRDKIVRRLQHRLLPEIKKAFHYEVTSLENLRIAKYEGSRGGKSHGHRDNSIKNVAHRRFAVSINLNAKEFEGGELRFPEFGPHLYKGETGAAVVFSCSLLHEALGVKNGARYVLLVFLFGDQ